MLLLYMYFTLHPDIFCCITIAVSSKKVCPSKCINFNSSFLLLKKLEENK